MDGKGVLLPAWGGVGKSTIMSRAVLHGRAKFLTDDHAIIDATGQMYLHTLPIHTYVYHLEQDAELRTRVLSSLTGMNRLQWHIGKTIKPKKAVRWVKREIFLERANWQLRRELHVLLSCSGGKRRTLFGSLALLKMLQFLAFNYHVGDQDFFRTNCQSRGWVA